MTGLTSRRIYFEPIFVVKRRSFLQIAATDLKLRVSSFQTSSIKYFCVILKNIYSRQCWGMQLYQWLDSY